MKYGLWGSWIEGNKLVTLAKTFDTLSFGQDLEKIAEINLKKFEQEYPNAVQRYEIELGE